MKKLTAGVLVALMVVMSAALATAAESPQALKGVNLSTSQGLTPHPAQQVRGAAAPNSPPPGLLLNSNAVAGLSKAGANVQFLPAFNNSRVFKNRP